VKKIFIILRKIIIILLPIIGLAVANLSLKSHTGFCLIKIFTGHECIGCGLTRAIVALSKFEFKTAYDFNHLIIVVAPLLFILWIIMLKNEFCNNYKTEHHE
jgi:hypothetical protein